MLNMLSVTPTDRANNPILAVRRNWAGETELARRGAPAQFSNTIWGNGLRCGADALPNLAMTASATLR